MKERPILFSAPMIRALLDNAKTQTRRPITMANSLVDGHSPNRKHWAGLLFDSDRVYVDKGPSPAGNPGPYMHVPHDCGETVHRIYPRIEVGDRLWVRETWAPFYVSGKGNPPTSSTPSEANAARYAATPDDVTAYPTQARWTERLTHVDHVWKPSIFMPRWASRITLEVTEVRAQRLHDISEEDAIAEGVERSKGGQWLDYESAGKGCVYSAVNAYHSLWDSINGAGAWAANPWVWAISFRRVLP